jgi:uncharacterized protein (TIGR03067 family)
VIYGLLVGADNEKAANQEYARFQGVWRFALIEVDGVKQDEAPLATNKLIISKDGRYVIVQGDRITHGILKLDPTKTPKHYDVTVTNGSAKGLTCSGIYEIDGDTYKICVPLRGKDRPRDFDSKPGGGCLFHVFKRENKEIKEALTAVGRKELAGKWQAATYALNGNKASAEDLKKVQLVIDAEGNTRALNDGKVFIASTTRIDPTAEPKTIDMFYTQGDSKGKTSLGIYKIEDDILTICRAAPDKARPTEFDSKPDSGQTLMTYKREKVGIKRE